MNNNKYDEKILDIDQLNKIQAIEDYSIQQDGIIYKLVIKEYENIINIKYNKYELNLNLNEFNSRTQNSYKSIKDCYNYLLYQFQNNNITIKSILESNYFLISYYDEKEKQDIDLKLLYNEQNAQTALSEIVSNYNSLLSGYQNLKKEIEKIKKNKLINNESVHNIPKNIKFSSDIITDSFAGYSYEDSFIVFKSADNKFMLVYATKEKTIISYDLSEKRSVCKKFKAHKNFITNFKYIYDEENYKDIIMSISKKDNNIKIWDWNNFELMADIININENNFLYSACFLKTDNNIFIITSNGKNLQAFQSNENFENLKLYNLQGELISKIEDTNDCTYFIDIYYDNNLDKNFIVTGNFNYVKSYDFDNKCLYHKYFENNNGIHPSAIINKIGEKIKLIESCEDGNIRIWGFHSCELIRKIKTENNNLYGICLWNENYIFVGCKDQSIKLIELKNGLLIKNLKGHKGRIISFKKIIQPDNNEILFSQSLDGTIKTWVIS